MTNAEKYLKDNVSVEELDKALVDYLCNEENADYLYYDYVKNFFERKYQKPTPTLTEDERVILRNFKECYKYIGREGMLYVGTHKKDSKFVSQVVIDEYKPDLFQFIKERRRI